jgi:dihydrofolate synthase / folylpolyglutamate synthase
MLTSDRLLAELRTLHPKLIDLSLGRITRLLDKLGNPQQRLPPVIHIAGTNGKGSVTAMTDAGLRAAGHRSARYTSPHLVRLNERFVIGGQAVDDDAMDEAIAVVRSAIEALRADGTLEVQPTFFEATTAAAFELFRRAAVEIAVVEVGLGGRLDATNVLSPEATAITSIGFDHQLYLGTTLPEIAREKAGIIKPGVPVVVGEMDPSAAAAIDEVARAAGAPVVRMTADRVDGRAIGLRGAHQRGNAAVALGLLEILDSRGTSVPPAAVDAALAFSEWPGRIDRRQLADGRALVMDAAHNPEGAAALARYLRSEPAPMPLVFAAMRDKDVDGMFRALLPAVASLIVTRASNARSADPDDLARRARQIAPALPIAIEPEVPAALDRAWRGAPHAPILVAGSIFLLGDVMQHLGLHW